MKPIAKFLFSAAIISTLLITLNSCSKKDDEDTPAELSVIIKSSVGVPQQGVIVGLYSTQGDANSGTNLLKNTKNTDASGISKFSDLDAGKSYWVRAANAAGYTVKETQSLSPGSNTFQMTI